LLLKGKSLSSMLLGLYTSSTSLSSPFLRVPLLIFNEKITQINMCSWVLEFEIQDKKNFIYELKIAYSPLSYLTLAIFRKCFFLELPSQTLPLHQVHLDQPMVQLLFDYRKVIWNSNLDQFLQCFELLWQFFSVCSRFSLEDIRNSIQTTWSSFGAIVLQYNSTVQYSKTIFRLHWAHFVAQSLSD